MNFISDELYSIIIFVLIIGVVFIIILICALFSVIQMSNDIRRIANCISRKSDTGDPQDGEVSL